MTDADATPARPAGGEPREASLFELLAAIRARARHYGYAVAIHGSLARDVDLVAVPWAENAASAEDVVEAIRDAVGGIILVAEGQERANYFAHPDPRCQNPVDRPHGRRAWAIQIPGTGTYLDLSVMPRVAASPAGGPPGERERFVEFARRIIEAGREGDADGGDIQEWATELGLLIPTEVTAPCGEHCACAEWDDFPQTCYRLCPTLAAHPAAGRPEGGSDGE